jgi:pimeloyl-ACP methyl ester carboxylesterase
VSHHRLLLVPQLTELEWKVKPLLESWAEVASFDAPGVGDEPPAEQFGPDAVAARGLIELDRRGWQRCVVVADEYGVLAAVRLAGERPDAVQALALGHACLSNETEGERAPIHREMQGVMAQLIEADYRTWVRHLTQISREAYDDELAERFLERVPRELARHFYGARVPPSERLETRLKALGAPMVFAKHEGCLLHTEEGFEDAVAAFPEADTVVCPEKPSTSPAFAEAIRSLCDELEQQAAAAESA